MSLIELEFTGEELSLWDKENGRLISWPMPKFDKLVEFVENHPNYPDAEEVTILDAEDGSRIFLTMAQWRTVVKYVETHPLDKHGWLNHIRDDGTVTGLHACPCHNIDNRSLNERGSQD